MLLSKEFLGLLPRRNSTSIIRKALSSLPTKKEAERKASLVLDKVYHELIAQRFEDVVVLETRFDANPRFLVLANAFNSRHLLNGTELINKFFKQSVKGESDEFADISISHEWNVIDLRSVVVHLFLNSCRDYYDIEQLWAVGEHFDSLVLGKSKKSEDIDCELPHASPKNEKAIDNN